MKETIFIYWDILLLRVMVISFLTLLLGGLWLEKKTVLKKCFLTAFIQGILWFLIFWLSLPRFLNFIIETVLFFGGFVYCYGLRGKGILLGGMALLQSTICFYGREKTLYIFILAAAFFYIGQTGTNKRKKSCLVSFPYGGKIVNCQAIVDSGNFLQEPYGHRPVCVIDSKCIPVILPKEQLLYVPYKSVGTAKGLMPVIKVGPVMLKTSLQQNIIPEMMLGISNESIGNEKEYQMLLHRSFEELI